MTNTTLSMSLLTAALIGILGSSSASSATPEPEVTAENGIVVATTGDGAAEAGLAMLMRGGTAMDAAMATALLQPCLAVGSYVSYAGIMTLVYFDAASGEVHYLDAGYNTVRGETEPLTIPGMSGPASGRTALVPGFFAGVEAAHTRFGKLPFAEIADAAIRCAEEGFVMSNPRVRSIDSRWDVLQRLPETKAIFTKADGTRYAVGDTFKQPALAQTLRAIVNDGIDAYVYNGPWAEMFVAAVQRDGGHMALEDLAAYEPNWIAPVRGSYKGYDVYGPGLPADAGVRQAEALQIAGIAGIAEMAPYDQTPSTLFQIMQIGKVGTVLSSPPVARRVSEILSLDLSPQSRLQQSTSDALWKAMQNGAIPLVSAAPTAGTEHTDAIVAVDASGNVAAVVHTINTVNWGATGIFVGGISIPDSATFQQQTIAALTPGSRLPVTTHPGMALKDGEPVLAFGSIGSGSQMRTLTALISVLGRGMTPQQAIDTPHIGLLEYSAGPPPQFIGTVSTGEYDATFLQALRDMGQEVKVNDSARGSWIGVSIDPETGTMRAGELRKNVFFGGGAVGY